MTTVDSQCTAHRQSQGRCPVEGDLPPPWGQQPASSSRRLSRPPRRGPARRRAARRPSSPQVCTARVPDPGPRKWSGRRMPSSGRTRRSSRGRSAARCGPISHRLDLQRRLSQDRRQRGPGQQRRRYGVGIYADGTLTGDYITITADDAGFDGGIYDGGGVVDPATPSDSTVLGNQPVNCAPTGSVTGCPF